MHWWTVRVSSESGAQATNPQVGISARLEESQAEMMNYFSLLPIKKGINLFKCENLHFR